MPAKDGRGRAQSAAMNARYQSKAAPRSDTLLKLTTFTTSDCRDNRMPLPISDAKITESSQAYYFSLLSDKNEPLVSLHFASAHLRCHTQYVMFLTRRQLGTFIL